MLFEELDLETVTPEELHDIEDYDVMSEDDIINKCHDYLDEHIEYLPHHYFDMFLDEEVIKSYFTDSYENYIEDIKSEESRLEEEMIEWSCETESEFLDKLVELALNEGFEYFTTNFGNSDGIKFLLSFGGINIEGLKDYILDNDTFEEILGLEIIEVEADNTTYFLVEN